MRCWNTARRSCRCIGRRRTTWSARRTGSSGSGWRASARAWWRTLTSAVTCATVSWRARPTCSATPGPSAPGVLRRTSSGRSRRSSDGRWDSCALARRGHPRRDPPPRRAHGHDAAGRRGRVPHGGGPGVRPRRPLPAQGGEAEPRHRARRERDLPAPRLGCRARSVARRRRRTRGAYGVWPCGWMGSASC